MRLLLIDGDPRSRGALTARLRACGADAVDSVEDLRGAREKLSSLAYEAVFLARPRDEALLGACAALRDEAVLAGRPILVVHPRVDAPSRGRALASGATDLVPPELGILALGEALQTALRETALRRAVTLGLVARGKIGAKASRVLRGAGYRVERAEEWPELLPSTWAAAVTTRPPPARGAVPVVPLWRGHWTGKETLRPVAELLEAVDLVTRGRPRESAALPARAASPAPVRSGAEGSSEESRGRFVEQARAEVRELDRILRHLADGEGPATLPGELAERARSLSSIAVDHGFEEAARLGGDLETWARGHAERAGEPLLEGASKLAELDGALRPPLRVSPARREAPTLLLLDDDPALGASFRAAAAARGMAAQVACDTREAGLASVASPPGLFFVSARLVVDPEEATRLRGLPTLADVPLTLLVNPRSVHERLAAIHLEADLVLDRPVAADDLMRCVRRMTEDAAGPRRPLVAVVGTARNIEALERRGFETLSLEIEEGARLPEIRADAILVDGSAGEVARVVRQLRLEKRLRPVPVLARCSGDDPEVRLGLLEAGADDVLVEGASEEEDAALLRARIQRFASLRVSAGVDPLTGLATWRRFEERLEDEVAIAERSHRPFSVASVELDPVGLELGARAQEALTVALASHLRKRVRRSDLVSRARGLEFLVLLRECTCDDGKQVMDSILADFRHQRVLGVAAAPSFSAGVASYPDHGGDPIGVLAAARRTRLAGRRDGSSALVRVSEHSRPGAAPRVGAPRVLVADHDENVRRLVGFALETRGYVVEHVADGNAAAGRLLENTKNRPPDLVLLEVDLPFVGGLELLRRLRDSGADPKPKVILLTLRKSESDVIRGFDLGAADHIAKPFSVPILVARVGALMGMKERF